MDWIIDWQLKRRNISKTQKDYLDGKRYRHGKRKAGGSGANQHTEQPGKNYQVARTTSERIATESGVSEKTVRINAKFSEAIDAIGVNAGPEVKAKILSGKSGLSKKDVMEVAALPAAKQAVAIREKKDQRRTRPRQPA